MSDSDGRTIPPIRITQTGFEFGPATVTRPSGLIHVDRGVMPRGPRP